MPFEDNPFDIKPDLMETNSEEEEGTLTMDDDLEETPTDCSQPPPSPNVNNSVATLHEERTAEEEDNDVTVSPTPFFANGKDESQQKCPTTAADNPIIQIFKTPGHSNQKTTPSNVGSDEEVGTDERIEDSKKDMRRKGPTVTRSLCPTCGKTFPNGAPYRHHVLTHSVDKPHSCHLCQKSFATQKWLRVHLKIIHTPGGNVKRFACSKCQKTFRTNWELRQHSYSHGFNKPCVCQICGKGFIRPSDLNTHTLIHTRNQPHVCHICPSTFRQKGHLQTHLAMAHPAQTAEGEMDDTPLSGKTRKTKLYQCAICGKVYRRTDGLRSHMKSIHNETLPNRQMLIEHSFPPAEYEKALTFPDPSDHTKVLYTCQTCGDVFKWKQAFKTHMQGVHWNEKVCQCQICGKVFKNGMGFHSKVCPPGQEDQDTKCRARSCGLIFASVEERKAHQREVHKRQRQRKKQACLPVKCYICNRRLSSTKTYGSHLRLHTLERPFLCPKCGGDFPMWSSWKWHMSNGCKGNAGKIRTLHCVICQRGYNNPDAFKAHTHPDPTDPKRIQYPCVTCGRVFKLSGKFLCHIKNVHKAVGKKSRVQTSCYFCHKSFRRPNLLKHMQTHTCRNCGKEFAALRTLKGLRTHLKKSCC